MPSGDCVSCPDGAVCLEPGATLANIELEEGWYRFSQTSTDIYSCPNSNCEGGNITGIELCSEASTGHLCSTCKPNYYMRDAVEVCTLCGDLNDLWWLFPGIVITIILLVGAVVLLKRRSINAWMARNSEWLEMIMRDLSTRMTGKALVLLLFACFGDTGV